MKKKTNRQDAKYAKGGKRGSRILLSLLLCVLGVLAVQLPSFAAARPEVVRLANGATLVVLEEKDSPLVAIDVFFRVGYAEEDNRNAGITSLLSRAWISSTAGGPGEFLLGTEIGELGGNVGSAFGGDYVEIWAVTAASNAAVGRAAQTLIMNIIGQPAFPDAAVQEAKRQQLRDLELENDQFFTDALGRLRARLWDRSPYARSPLGTPETVRALTAGQVRAYYKRFFHPDRAVIVVAGNITPENARHAVETNMKAVGWDRGRSPATTLAPETLGRTPPDVRVNRQAPLSIMLAGFLTPGTRQVGDYPALLVLDALIGGGKSSRLFRNVRDAQGIGYEIGTLFQPGLYQSLLVGYVATAPYRLGRSGPQPFLEQTRTALLDEMRSLLSRPPDAAEMERAKALVRGRYALRHQRLKDRAFLLGWSEVMGLGAEFDADYDARINAVTAEDIKRVAGTVLGGNYVLAVTISDPAPPPR